MSTITFSSNTVGGQKPLDKQSLGYPALMPYELYKQELVPRIAPRSQMAANAGLVAMMTHGHIEKSQLLLVLPNFELAITSDWSSRADPCRVHFNNPMVM